MKTKRTIMRLEEAKVESNLESYVPPQVEIFSIPEDYGFMKASTNEIGGGAGKDGNLENDLGDPSKGGWFDDTDEFVEWDI